MTSIIPTATSKRLCIGASVIVYIVLGAPIWWQLTSFKRPPIPHQLIDETVQTFSLNTALLPIQIKLHILQGPPSWQLEVENVVRRYTPKHEQVSIQLATYTAKECTWSTSYTQTDHFTYEPPPCLQSTVTRIDFSTNAPEQLDAALHSLLTALHTSQPGVYDVILAPSTTSKVRAFQGEHRHAWLLVPGEVDSAVDAESVLRVLGSLLDSFIGPLTGPLLAAAAQRLPFSPGSTALLSFTLCNAQPARGDTYVWDFGRFRSRYVAPVVEVLGPLGQLEVESQVLLHTSARLNATWSTQHSAYTLPSSRLPFFLDSEWRLDPGRKATPSATTTAPSLHHSITPTRNSTIPAAKHTQQTGLLSPTDSYIPPHVLHHVVFVPPASQRPLQLLLPNGTPSPSNSFWLPSWGGVLVINPQVPSPAHTANTGDSMTSPADAILCDSQDESACTRSSTRQPAIAPSSLQVLDDAHMHIIAASFIAQLRALLGLQPLPATPSSGPLTLLPPKTHGISQWELDQLVRAKVAFDLNSTAHVLGSLSRLVKKLPNLEMPDVIGTQVAAAVQGCAEALGFVNQGDYVRAALAARHARATAEAAFAHPAVLAQKNFPDTHKIGIYVPFFPVVGVVVVRLLVQEGRKLACNWKHSCSVKAHVQ